MNVKISTKVHVQDLARFGGTQFLPSPNPLQAWRNRILSGFYIIPSNSLLAGITPIMASWSGCLRNALQDSTAHDFALPFAAGSGA